MTTRPIVFHSKSQIKIINVSYKKYFFLKNVALEASSKCLTNLPSVFCSESKVGTNRIPLWDEPLFPQRVPLHTTKAVFKSAESFSLKVQKLFFTNSLCWNSVFFPRIFLWTSRLHFWQPSQGLLSVVPRKVALFLENIKKV